MNSGTNKNILFVTGGTGGHIYPALAVYNLFKTIKSKIFFATDSRGLKFQELSKIDPFLIKVKGFEGKSLINKIISLLFLIKGFFKALNFIKKNNIKTVVGFGSYVQVPFVFAALFLKKNVLLHEGNAVMGKANKIFWKYISTRTSAFNLKPYYPDTIQVGMPVRNNILNLYKKNYDPVNKRDTFNLLILGGSQGSKLLSYKLSKQILKLPMHLKSKLIIYHQVIKEDLYLVKNIYKKNNINSTVVNYFNDLSVSIEKANLVISRAGSSSIFENATVGVPVIFIPIKNSSGNHQYENAKVLKNKMAAWLFEEKEIEDSNFLKFLEEIIINKNLLKKCSLNIKKFCKPDAAKNLKELILNLEKTSV